MRTVLASPLSLLLGLAACGGRGPAGSPSGVDGRAGAGASGGAAAGASGTGGAAGISGQSGSTDAGGERADVSDALGVEPGSSDARDLGASVMDATDAYAGVCPPLAGPLTPQSDLCRSCPGVACAPKDACVSTYHDTGWFTETCTCVAGHLGCCEWSDLYGVTFCDYGGFSQPACPPTRPASGDPCGASVNGCRFTDPCCAGDSTTAGGSALCANGMWTIICRPPTSGNDCSAVPSGTRCDAPDAGDAATTACRCDDRDGGGKAWICGAGI